MSSSFTVTRIEGNSHLPKPLNQRNFLLAGTHLATITDKSARMTQPQLRDN